jgi:hypothetical protein
MTLANNTVLMLNAIRNSASADYQARIPEATRTNFADISTAMRDPQYTPLLNEFTNALVTKIAKQIFSNKMAKNKLAQFKKGNLTYGKDIEDIFVEMAKAVSYDKEGSNPLTRKKPDIKTLYHRENYQAVYEVSVSDEQARNAFTSEGGLNTLSSMIVQSMYSGANYDEYVNMKNLVGSYDGYSTYEVEPITNEATAKDFVKTVRKAVADLSYMSTAYNAEGVNTYSEKEELVMLVHKDVIAEVDVEVLAKAYNMGKTNFEPIIIEVDDFGTMTDTYALLMDKDFFLIFDTLRTIETIRNPKGLFTNYFLHVWQLQSLCRFKNVVRFKTPTA